ncbi:MAG: hypothetical protein NZ521_02590 [Flammeovirgaceae bacterium]|nr:hypothetical protein [Flammeovirgaceae bacterium]MDW8286922.1 hypothetical protein [Flammeovirgaceae bacterium]
MKTATLLLSIHFLVVSLLPNRNANELGLLPYLFKHYQEHIAQENLTFLEFLKLHYLDMKHHNEDHENHKKLPFDPERLFSVHLLKVFTFFIPHFCCFAQKIFSYKKSISFHIGTDHFTSSLLLENIWQPPKNN